MGKVIVESASDANPAIHWTIICRYLVHIGIKMR
jgi:hypothetical protein